MGLHLEILALISFIPLVSFYAVYVFRSEEYSLSIVQWIAGFFISLAFTYTNMLLVVHQVGFYELFFTDIMQWSAEAQNIVDSFLAQYGDKHRHLGLGLMHGALNWICYGLPVLLFGCFLSKELKTSWKKHALFGLIVSLVIGGCLALWV